MRLKIRAAFIFVIVFFAPFAWNLKFSGLPFPDTPQTASWSSTSPDEVPAPFKLSSACLKFIRSLDKDFVKDWVEVPERIEDKNSAKIFVFYYHPKSAPDQTSAPPTIVFNGGPGGVSYGTYNTLEANNRSLPKDQKTWNVYMDQRGNGCSSPYPDDKNDARLVRWGTSAIVHDAEAIREKLGFKRWIALGHSYGAAILERYILLAPQSLIYAVGHGAVSMEDPEDYRLRWEHQLEVIDLYLKTFPDDLEKIKDIVHRRLCSPEVRGCGASLLMAAGHYHLPYKDTWFQLHMLIHNMMLRNLSAPLGATESPSESALTSIKINNALVMEAYGITSPLPRSEVLRDKALQIFGGSEALALSEAWSALEMTPKEIELKRQQYLKYIKDFSLHPLKPSQVKKSLQQNPDLRYFLFSSEYDYATPAVMISKSAEQMGPQVIYKKIKNGTHQSYDDPQIMRLLNKNLDKALHRQGK